jgi:hypothetical protein
MREELTLCRETVGSGGFLDLLYGGNSGQREEWIWTADLLVQCQEASSVESQRLKPGELLTLTTTRFVETCFISCCMCATITLA